MDNLKKYLQINGGFSILCAIIMLLLSNKLGAIFGLKSGVIFIIVGGGLLIFGGFVFFVSQNHLTNRSLVQAITILDALWVLGSLIIVIFQLFGLSSTGYILITIVLTIIAFFGINQFRFNK